MLDETKPIIVCDDVIENRRLPFVAKLLYIPFTRSEVKVLAQACRTSRKKMYRDMRRLIDILLHGTHDISYINRVAGRGYFIQKVYWEKTFLGTVRRKN